MAPLAPVEIHPRGGAMAGRRCVDRLPEVLVQGLSLWPALRDVGRRGRLQALSGAGLGCQGLGLTGG